MAIGVYGTIRPADVNIDDIDIFYNFSPNRGIENNIILRLEPTEILTEVVIDNEEDDLYLSGGDNILEGLFNLKLPATIFNQIGIYTIYIKPKTYLVDVVDCNVLSSLPTTKGLLVEIEGINENKNTRKIPLQLATNNALQGYRIEYLDANGNKIRNLSRYIVTSNRVVPVNENIGNTNQQSTRYRFEDTGSLLFLQLTPSSSSNVKPNQQPFIGLPGQTIKISNTFFSPLVIEIDMVENTVETLADIIIGEQIKDVKNGILTYYDKDRNISKQYNLFQIKDSVGDVPLFEVKEKRTNIDTTQNFDDVISDI
jgi:hypothetical protein